MSKNLAAEGIPGWFYPEECRCLYNHTLLTNGPILEIGHFLGRSTAAICEALRDARMIRPFRSYDLGFRSTAEFEAFYSKVHPEGGCTPPMFIEHALSKGITSTEAATANLRNAGLLDYVTLISGNFIESDEEKVSFIFCDAAHEPHEIALNLPAIIARSSPGCIWMLHDMNPENIKTVLNLSDSLLVTTVGSLGTFRYIG